MTQAGEKLYGEWERTNFASAKRVRTWPLLRILLGGCLALRGCGFWPG